MAWRMTAFVVASYVLCAGCGREAERTPPALVPPVVTADIQAAIENHIEEEILAGEGYFQLSFGEQELNLKLVRVHTEYLSNLGPRRHFACVDLADISGDVYDVDFFLAGDPGAMSVIETIVHKINGQPYHAWEQHDDGTWHRVAVADASRQDLGVINGSDEFDFTYQVTLPEMTEAARMWLPLPNTDSFQTVEVLSMRIPGESRTLEERRHGNRIIYVELGPEDSGETIEILYHVQRREKAAFSSATSDPSVYLDPERLVPASENFRSIAQDVVKNKKGDLVRARALYDHAIDRMRYIKHGSGWGKGDAVYACDVRTGNCTDFHSYFIALARSVGIPARFAIGAAIPSARDDGGISGYHCWAEFYADGKWWPVDISEGDKYSSLATYYFGHHPANRVELSRGRDLVVDPGPASGPINFLAYPILEIGGRPATAKVVFSFKRTAAAT